MFIKETVLLPLMEAFYTIQGEGYHQGKAAYFIRLAGCDVGCYWCDVKESWDKDKHPLKGVGEIVKDASVHPARLAVVTGGEPLMHNLDSLCEELHKNGFRTHIETSGTSPLSGSWDWICLSPKKFKTPIKDIYHLVNELKIIVSNRHDLEWAKELSTLVKEDCILLLQPEWSKSEEILPLMIDFVKENPAWRVSLQTHKYMQVP